MRRFWVVYGIIGVALLAYTGLGRIASHTTTVPIRLTLGDTAQASIIRLSEGRLSPSTQFSGQRHGPDKARFDERETAKVEIEFAVADAPPVRYSLGGTTGWGSVSYARALATRGEPGPRLHFGFNHLRLKIVAVDPSFVGERIDVWVEPALGFKASQASLEWLWPSFLSSLYLPAFALIGLFALIVQAVKAHRHRPSKP